MNDEYPDEQLEAECVVIGSMMLHPPLLRMPLGGLGPDAFCVPFHRAIYHAVFLLMELGQEPTPLAVWDLVERHPDAEAFSLQHLVDLAVDAAQPDAYIRDWQKMLCWGFTKCAERMGSVQ